jgi:tRNA dimethylallyltransferase
VDLAVRFDGEIINADAMQMYKGLPIITNQINTEEQRGIPHHLLATIDLDQPTWVVGVFAREATRLIREIRSRGKLPIIVGGTHYYISSLLFDNGMLESSDGQAESEYQAQTDIELKHPVLAGPTDLMLQRLREVDPVMASRWHPDDRRKIRRSLEIFLTTGRKASEVYAEQEKARESSAAPDSPWEALMFWVYSNPDVLKERLDRRVDKMETAGLLDEARHLHRHLRDRTAAGEDIDRTRGIWQSIGFKQFEPFLDAEATGASPQDLGKLKDQGMELTKTGTRQYARNQLKWLRNKTIPELNNNGAMRFMYLLDSTEAARFSQTVLSPAADITRAFLDGADLPEPASISDVASRMLSAFGDKNLASKPKYEARLCELCNMTITTEEQWAKHARTQRHRRALKHKSRTALVPVERTIPSPSEIADIDLDGFP